jgi:hypothetical protein
MITTPLHDVRIEGNTFSLKASEHKTLVGDLKNSYYFDIRLFEIFFDVGYT